MDIITIGSTIVMMAATAFIAINSNSTRKLAEQTAKSSEQQHSDLIKMFQAIVIATASSGTSGVEDGIKAFKNHYAKRGEYFDEA